MTSAHAARRGAVAASALLAVLGTCAPAHPGRASAQAPGPALAGGWSQPLDLPAAREGWPRLLVAGRGGGRIVVSAPSAIYDGAGDVTVDVVPPGGAPRRSVVPRSLLVDWARTRGGDVDLLLVQGTQRPLERPGRLALYRVRHTGAVQRVWTGGAPATAAQRSRAGARVSPSSG
jgi:hypothetical protein